MPTTVGRLKDGDMLIAGEVNERLPAVTSGLIAHYPFDGTALGVDLKRNLLDTSLWKVGTNGSQGYFTQNGETAANSIITKENPWGWQDVTWATLGNDATSDADGGWGTTGFSIDHTKKYRLSVWIRRENAGNGRTYFGCQGDTVCNLGTTTVNTNPYFYSGLATDIPEVIDNWTLWVGYIHPSDYTGGNDPYNGIYKLDGTRTRGFTDYKWEVGETVGGHRTYLYYSTSTTERQYWYRPRMEVCDGTEPSIEQLLQGCDDIIRPKIYTHKDPVRWINPSNVSVSGNTLTKTSTSSSWNAGAQSEQKYDSGNVFVEWKVKYVPGTEMSNGAEMMGLNSNHTTNDYIDIDFAIYTHEDGSLKVYENGTSKGSFGTWDQYGTDIFKVAIENGVVNYYKNGSVFYTSATAPTYPIYADCSLHCHGAANKITNAYIGAVSNEIYTDDGVYIEATTTNLLTNGDFSNGTTDWSTWGSPPTREHSTKMQFNGSNTIRLITNGTNQGYSRTIAVTAGVTYTLSAWTYLISGQSVIMGNVDGGWPSAGADMSKMGVWQRISVTFTPAVTANIGIYIGRNGGGASGEYYITNVQLETKSYATYYTSSTIANGTLTIPANINPVTSSFSFNYWITPNKVDATDSSARIEMKNFGKIWRYYPTGADTRRYIWDYTLTPTGTRTYKDLIHATPFSLDKPEMITLVWDTSKAVFYRNGVYWTEKISDANCLLGVIDSIAFFNTSGKVQNVSLYNRALASSEVTQMYKQSFSMKKDGTVIGAIVEKSSGYPLNAKYFPLGSDASDIYRTTMPVTESNTVYASEGLWVGRAYTNLLSSPWIGFSSNSHLEMLDINYPNPLYSSLGVNVVRQFTHPVSQSRTGDQRMVSTFTTLTKGSTYTYKAWIYVPQGQLHQAGSLYFAVRQSDTSNWSGTNIVSSYQVHSTTKYDEWQQVSCTFTVRSDIADTNVHVCYYNRLEIGNYIYATGGQLTEGNFLFPLVNGTRAQGRLDLPASLVTGQDFAFSLWARCDGFDNEYNMPFDAYPHLYVSMRQGKFLHFSFQNNGVQTSITGGTLVQGKWHHIAGIKTATGISMYLDGVKIGTHTASGTGYVSTIDGEGTLGIGSYHTQYPLNGYVRDLMIESGTITLNDAKVTEIYKTQMRVYRNNILQVRGQIIERQVL